MKSFLSLQLQTAIKVSLAMCIALVISNFLGFPLSFVAPMLAGVTTLSGLGLDWFLLTRGTLMMAIAFCFGAILSILWGNNCLTIFILVLGMGFWWNYLQLHGFIGSFLGLMIKCGFVIIYANNPDPVNASFIAFSNYFIGVTVGTIFNRLFWVNTTEEILTKNLQNFANISRELITVILNGYLESNFNEALAQNFLTTLNKTVQGSENILKLSSFDPTNKSADQTQWMKIIKSQKNILSHLSALTLLVKSSQQINLPSAINSQVTKLFNSFRSSLTIIPFAMLNNKKIDLSDINQNLINLQNLLEKNRKNEIINNQPLSEIITFYSLFNRCKKLTQEINQWGDYSLNKNNMLTTKV